MGAWHSPTDRRPWHSPRTTSTTLPSDKCKHPQNVCNRLCGRHAQSYEYGQISQKSRKMTVKTTTLYTWNYLWKYKNNHAKNSLPPETRSNASTDARIWESGPATLNPLNWHCYRFALGHHLFNHKLSPYDEKSETDFFPPRFHTSTGVNVSPSTHPLFMLPFTLLELTTQIKKLFPDKSPGPSGITNQMLQVGDADFQSLLLLLWNSIWGSHVQPTNWQLSLMATHL